VPGTIRAARLRSKRLCAVLAIVPAVAAAVVAGPSASSAADSRPTLTFTKPDMQASLGAAYTKGLHNLLDINTVRYDPNTYNQTGLLTDPPGTFIQAGADYGQPWTRDGSMNPWNAASLLEPDTARNTLWSVVRRQSNGQLLLAQDSQWWDQVVWLTAAWNHYLVTGDQRFLTDAYQTATNTLNLRRSQNFNATYGLFQGPAFFNDGIAGYPVPPADTAETHGSFVGDYPGTDTMMTLSTNALYYSAYRSAAQMADTLGRPASESAALNAAADALKTNINKYLWIPAKGLYGYFIHGNDGNAGTLDQSEEGSGLSFAILFGIAAPDQAQSILRNAHLQPYGIVDVFPHFARYNDAHPGRHNVIVWPMVQGLWASAAAQAGDMSHYASEVTKLAGMANASGGFEEIYNAGSGKPDGGWQNGGHWASATDQTWSATAYLRTMYHGLFGIRFAAGGLTFQPVLPSGWGDVTLSGLHYRGATLTIALHGAGTTVSKFTVDGAAPPSHTIPVTLTGTHPVDITLG
jgi:hypothetical protein